MFYLFVHQAMGLMTLWQDKLLSSENGAIKKLLVDANGNSGQERGDLFFDFGICIDGLASP